MRRLSRQQRAVLEWVGEGCPERGWPDYAHRISARSLHSRGLVKVTGRGERWTATLTEAGRALLAGEIDESTADTRPERRRRSSSGQSRGEAASRGPTISGSELLEQIQEHGGLVRVEDPPAGLRAAYRRALTAIPGGEVPAGKRVTFRGRDRGDLVIELVDRPTESLPELPLVPIPEAPDLGSEVIGHLAARPELMGVFESSRDRALRLVQALVDECVRRGHQVRHRGDEPGVEIVIAGEAIAVTISEENDKRTRVTEEDVMELKYEWQRARPVTVKDWSGRLTMTLVTGAWSEPSWADRKRWTLDSRLPRLLVRAEQVAAECARARVRAEQERCERQRLWDESLPR
ncbi:MAG: hypothetical protein ACRCYU_14590, partial [Nocardioides sp.]